MYEIEELLKNNVVSIVNNGNGKKLSWTWWSALEKWVIIPSSRGKIGQFDTIEEAIKELLKEN